MSNLIPRQRTDKNGRNVIRHMKTDLPDTTERKTLPPVKGIAKPSRATDYTDEQIVDIFGLEDHGSPEDRATNLKIVGTMREANKTTLTTALKLIEAGNEAGTREVRAQIEKAASRLGAYFDNPDSYPSLKAVLKFSWTTQTKNEMVKGWAVASVVGDLDPSFVDDVPDYMYGSAVNRAHMLFSGRDDRFKTPLDTDYWRGLTMLYFAGVEVDIKNRLLGASSEDEARDLAKWLLSQDDLNLSVSIAKRLRVYEIPKLEKLVAEAKKAPSMSSGML